MGHAIVTDMALQYLHLHEPQSQQCNCRSSYRQYPPLTKLVWKPCQWNSHNWTYNFCNWWETEHFAMFVFWIYCAVYFGCYCVLFFHVKLVFTVWIALKEKLDDVKKVTVTETNKKSIAFQKVERENYFSVAPIGVKIPHFWGISAFFSSLLALQKFRERLKADSENKAYDLWGQKWETKSYLWANKSFTRIFNIVT